MPLRENAASSPATGPPGRLRVRGENHQVKQPRPPTRGLTNECSLIVFVPVVRAASPMVQVASRIRSVATWQPIRSTRLVLFRPGVLPYLGVNQMS
jgi:hypothetical protein